jgi:hypothetical protein
VAVEAERRDGESADQVTARSFDVWKDPPALLKVIKRLLESDISITKCMSF